MVKRIQITEAIRSRLKILRVAEQNIGCSSAGPMYGDYEAVKLEFADEVLLEIERSEDRRARMDALPRREPVPVVELRLSPKRRRA